MENNTVKKAGAADHLANERTFLAWIRTSIALMGLGFVIVKFALFLRQMAFILGDKNPAPPSKGYSAEIGVSMVAFGALIALLSFTRYRSIEKQLNENAFFPSKWLVALLTIVIVLGSLMLVLYLLPSL
jgi:putative membrane protein